MAIHRWCLGLCMALGLPACAFGPTLERQYVRSASDEFEQRVLPEPRIVRDADLESVPEPVARYLRYAGVVGRPAVWNMRVEMQAEMFMEPGGPPIAAASEQHNFFDQPTRLFFLDAYMFGMPVDVLHRYSKTHATMMVRVAELFDVTDAAGDVLDTTETVTLLNDMAVMAPASLLDPRLSFRAVDERQTEVSLQNGKSHVRAVLHFGEQGELVDFVSHDRSALGQDGVFRKFRFSTPLRAYRDFGGMRLASEGDAVYDYPEGPFRYATFRIERVDYNVHCFEPRPIGPKRPTRNGIHWTDRACVRER